MVSLSIVIPCYQGDPTGVIEGLTRLFPDRQLEIIVVDDGNQPARRRFLEEISRGWETVRLISLAERSGQAHATLVGVAAAEAPVVVTMDDDGEHPPEAVPGLLATLEEGYDLVYGAPRSAGRRPHRSIGTRLNNRLFSSFLGKPKEVPVTSFRAIRRGALDRALAEPVRFGYLSAMLFSTGARAGVHYYPPPAFRGGGRRSSRYRPLRLFGLYWRLLLHWGPLRFLSCLSHLPKRRFGCS